MWVTQSLIMTFLPFIPGTRTQQTESGSHASDSNHLAGMESTKKEPENKIVQTFCIKNNYVGDGDFTWEKGTLHYLSAQLCWTYMYVA